VIVDVFPTDSEWEAEFQRVIESELAVAQAREEAEAQARAGYALQPLTASERCVLRATVREGARCMS